MTMDLTNQFGLLFVLLVAVVIAHLLLFYVLTGAPPVPSGKADRSQICNSLKQSQLAETANIFELGAGWGGLALALHRAFPHAEIYALERSPVPYFWMRVRFAGFEKIHVRRQDFHKTDLHKADAVTCFLMIKPMRELAKTLDKQLRTDTPVVSLAFRFRDRIPNMTANSPNAPGGVALYRWPAKKMLPISPHQDG